MHAIGPNLQTGEIRMVEVTASEILVQKLRRAAHFHRLGGYKLLTDLLCSSRVFVTHCDGAF